jgi:tol-pal system protein YbgF
MIKRRYPCSAAWFASAALVISGGCANAQAPIYDASQPYGRGSAASSAPAAPAAQGGQGGELLLQVQALQQEVMQLRGIVEEQAHQIEALKQQGLDRYIDLDRRLSQLGGTAAAGDMAAASSGAIAADAVPMQPVGQDAASASGLPGDGVSGSAAPAPVEPAQANEYDAYKAAYAKVKEQNFAVAIQSFQGFIATYPNSTLTPNAYYWLGELYLQTPQDLNAAERAFTKVIEDFPQHSKAPDSLYKLGRVHYMKGDRAKAQGALQQVIDEYGASGSAAPQLAKQFLDQNFN